MASEGTQSWAFRVSVRCSGASLSWTRVAVKVPARLSAPGANLNEGVLVSRQALLSDPSSAEEPAGSAGGERTRFGEMSPRVAVTNEWIRERAEAVLSKVGAGLNQAV